MIRVVIGKNTYMVIQNQQSLDSMYVCTVKNVADSTICIRTTHTQIIYFQKACQNDQDVLKNENIHEIVST